MLQEHSRPAAQWTSRSAAPRTTCTRTSRFGTAPLAIVIGLLASTATVSSQPSSGSLDPNASSWRPWVLNSTRELQIAPPAEQASELQQLHAFAKQRDTAALERIRYWDFWSPSHRWNEMLVDISAATPLGTSAASRAFALLNVAIDDALTAAWEAKYTHNRKRPSEIDNTLAADVAVPPSPSYPCEHSVAAGAAAAIIAHVYPKEAQRVTAAAEEASRSRVLAGVVFPSDAQAGLELGRKVAERAIEFANISDKKWSGTMPSGPGIWKGENPGGVNDVEWKTFAMASPSQFRPGPPPAPDSAERAAELAEVKNFKRTPLTNAKATYWQFGQQGQPGLIFRIGQEVGLRLAEAGVENNARRAARAYALVYVAHYDGWVASQDAKFHYWTARPNQFDPSITTTLPTPNFPGYPSNAATLGKGPAVVLSHLFPSQAPRYAEWAREFGESRLWAGIHFRSDLVAGWEIGQRVGEAVVERARRDPGL
jgi:PAP2 superfamily